MTDTQTVESVMRDMESRFKSEKAAGVDATFQFDISGEGGGTWHAVIKDQQANFSEGPAENPTVVIKATDEDWVNIVTGKLNPTMAFMTGKVKVEGNVGLATQLGNLFL